MWSATVRTTTLSAVVGLLLLAGASGGAAWHRRNWPRSPVAEGVIIDGHRVPDRDVAGWLEDRREAALARTVRFRHDDQIFEATFESAGISLDAEATLGRARHVAHSGSIWRRLDEAARARRGEVEIASTWKLDPAPARILLAGYAPAIHLAPVDARIDLTRHARTPDGAGARARRRCSARAASRPPATRTAR